jgi:chemotaxis protein methyltransferase CheR
VHKDFDIELDLLLEAIFRKYQHDFRQYARSSLHRRLLAALQELSCPSLSGLQDRLLREPGMMDKLLPYLTVQVSDMFRDPAFFRAIRTEVVPLLRTWPSLKVWVAGCSSGEEVYSLAIVLREEGLLQRTLLYATDIYPPALEKAAAGIYDLGRMAQFSESYLASGGKASLSDYYTAAYGAAIFDKSLRRNVVFSDHSLATDAVFAEVHLITCRNVLIYFNRALQERAVGLFHSALTPQGFLGLGSGESLHASSFAPLFGVFAMPERIYRRKP